MAENNLSEMDNLPPGINSPEDARRINAARDKYDDYYRRQKAAKAKARSKERAKERRAEPNLPFGKPLKKYKPGTYKLKESIEMSPTLRIVDILASGSPEHGLKDAVNAALSEKVGIVLDAFKQEIAGNYFGQSAPQLDEEVESLDEVTYSPAAKATKKIERRWDKQAYEKRKASGEPVRGTRNTKRSDMPGYKAPKKTGQQLAAISSIMGDHEDAVSYHSKMGAYWKERQNRGTYGPGAPADRTMDRRYKTIDRHTRARFNSRNYGGQKEDMSEDNNLQELSKKTLGSYIKKASHDVAHKGAITREFANRATADRKAGNYVGGRKNAELSDKTFNKSWKRRQGMAKAVDKLTKD